MSVLKEIIEHKQREVQEAKKSKPIDALKKELASRLMDIRGFKYSLETSPHNPCVIAEVKRKSPSKGVLRENLDVQELVKAYEANGASAISVLTDEKYFGGHLDDLKKAKEVTTCPILRKDFMIDEYQIYESLIGGADAVLLIVAALSPEMLKRLYETAVGIGLDVLLEVHKDEELQNVEAFPQAVIGINNRDLNTFNVDLKTTEKLMKLIPAGRTAVSESGIQSPEDLERLKKQGVRAVLVGESLVTQKDPGEALKKLARNLS